MKMLFLSYKESINDELMDILDELGIASFTKWDEVLSRRESGHSRMGTHIWPGVNSALILAVEDDTAERLMARVRSFNETLKFEGITAMSWNLDDACSK